MRIWYDTEFIEDGHTIDLISIGMEREDGARLYLENGEANYGLASPWVQENVMPHLNFRAAYHTSRSVIAAHVKDFCLGAGTKPELWAYYCAYDHVALCQLFGRMIDLPEGFPYYTLDVKQLAVSVGNPRLPARRPNMPEHHALWDAVWTRDAWDYCMAIWDRERAPEHPAGYEKEEKLTAEQWLMRPEFLGVRVIDPDGWRQAGRTWEDRLTHKEFFERLSHSSLMMYRERNQA